MDDQQRIGAQQQPDGVNDRAYYLFTCLFTYLPAYLFTYLLTYLPTYLPT